MDIVFLFVKNTYYFLLLVITWRIFLLFPSKVIGFDNKPHNPHHEIYTSKLKAILLLDNFNSISVYINQQ